MPIKTVAPPENNPVRLNQAVRDLCSGRSNAHAKEVLSLASDGVATTTTVIAPGIGLSSHVSITPRNAAMATELRSHDCYVSAINQGTGGQPGSFVITHSASATDRKFTYGFQG